MMMNYVYRFSFCLGVTACLAGTLCAQSPSRKPGEPASVPAADGGLGSTMTLDARNVRRELAVEGRFLNVQPAGETEPALRHRLWMPDYEAKPGSALLHFSRAQLMWQSFPVNRRSEIESWNEDEPPAPGELKQAVESLSHVYDELHLLATSEDMSWDHRLRDKRGPDVYMYLLPDVQESRSLARILARKIEYQLSVGDIDGVVDSLRDGFRLAAFVGQGETLVQQLVGMAIQGMMLDKVYDLIELQDSPNLYWPLATLPRPMIDVTKSVQFELGNVRRVLPILEEAENASRPDEYWSREFAKLAEHLEALGGSDETSKVAFAVIGVAAVEPAKERLVDAGFDAKLVESMPAMRAVLLDASVEIERIADDLAKANYLPGALGQAIVEREQERFAKWSQENLFRSGAAAIVGLLMPAVQAAEAAGVRQEYFINRLMTIEAIRMHAHEHNGQLPSSLSELDPVPALLNPFKDEPFRYSVKETGDGRVVTLSAEVPTHMRYFQEIQIQFE